MRTAHLLSATAIFALSSSMPKLAAQPAGNAEATLCGSNSEACQFPYDPLVPIFVDPQALDLVSSQAQDIPPALAPLMRRNRTFQGAEEFLDAKPAQHAIEQLKQAKVPGD